MMIFHYSRRSPVPNIRGVDDISPLTRRGPDMKRIKQQFCLFAEAARVLPEMLFSFLN